MLIIANVKLYFIFLKNIKNKKFNIKQKINTKFNCTKKYNSIGELKYKIIILFVFYVLFSNTILVFKFNTQMLSFLKLNNTQHVKFNYINDFVDCKFKYYINLYNIYM